MSDLPANIPSTGPRCTRDLHGQSLDERTEAIWGRAVGHAENFPVASWLCPAHLRPAVRAIYHFARCADDLADEGDWNPGQRQQALRRYRQALEGSLRQAAASSPKQPPGADLGLSNAPDTPLPEVQPHAAEDPGEPSNGDWPEVFVPLTQAVQRFQLPAAPLHGLLSAFEQDVARSASGQRCADGAELLAYCRCSANPVGRLLLHLYQVDDALALAQSDGICSALQLINFWQDISEDEPRGRHYLPLDSLRRHQAPPPSPDAQGQDAAALSAAVAELCHTARQLMEHNAALVHRLPGRAGWELRLVVQGGLRILDKIEASGFQSWRRRPTLRASDLPLMFWRAFWM